MLENNFVSVGRGSLIDPVLKLRLTTGRFELDDSTIKIELNYDSELQADRLTMPIPPERLKRLKILDRKSVV